MLLRTREALAPWIRNPSDDLAISKGCYFDPAAADRIIRFIETFCRPSQGDSDGPLKLLGWQRDFLSRLYGWRRPDGRRRFRTAYLEVPKKNGKSTLLSAVALYHLMADGERGPKVFCNAYDRAQASIIFDEAVAMVRASPDLARRLDVVESKSKIRFPKNNGRLQANSADVPSKDGANTSFVVFDELHRQDTWDLWRVFKYAGAARRQPLTLSITTAGVDRLSVCYDQHDKTERVNLGRDPDWQHLGVIYGASAEDDWRDPAVWARCNPSLGHTLSIEDFEKDVEDVERRPSELNEFLRLRLCVWTQSDRRFFERDHWDVCGRDFPTPSWFAGRRCYAGLDLSATTDLTAFARIFADGDLVYALIDVWIPGESARKRSERDRVPYLHWIEQGLARKTEGRTVDPRAIRARILEAHAETPIAALFADPWNAKLLLKQLLDDGLPVTEINQTMSCLTGATKELERLVVAGQLRHGNHPVLTWSADNAEAKRDSNDNIRLQATVEERIDPLSRLVNAIAAKIATPEAERSVYTDRGLLFL
ncbi:MAG: terminase TerL endonuclease subunit [Isosphaeraceae bacterium]